MVSRQRIETFVAFVVFVLVLSTLLLSNINNLTFSEETITKDSRQSGETTHLDIRNKETVRPDRSEEPLGIPSNEHHTGMVRKKPKQLRAFVYEDLPASLTWDVENCEMSDRVRGQWNKRNNFKADIPIIYLFKSYPGRTWDPTEADVFVVPYPHKSHCICNLNHFVPPRQGKKLGCPQVPDKDVDLLLSSLKFWNHTSAKRHLFILSGDYSWSNKKLESMPLILTIGPKPEKREGAIVIPYLNNHDDYQPSVIRQRSGDWWTTRPRKYAFAYFYGGAQFRDIRGVFQTEVEHSYGNTIGELPFATETISNFSPQLQNRVFETYRQSVFCPCLPGDNAPQKRFFDAAMSGCLPVVLSYNQSRLAGRKSWFRRGGPSVQASYPFSNAKDVQIDYESFVVQVPENVTNIKPTLEAILADPQDLRRRQENLRKYAPLFSYGLGDNAHVHRDAFSGIIASVQQYLDGMKTTASLQES